MMISINIITSITIITIITVIILLIRLVSPVGTPVGRACVTSAAGEKMTANSEDRLVMIINGLLYYIILHLIN